MATKKDKCTESADSCLATINTSMDIWRPPMDKLLLDLRMVWHSMSFELSPGTLNPKPQRVCDIWMEQALLKNKVQTFLFLDIAISNVINLA